MLKQKLGRLERVSLRAVWENEAGDFTPWLGGEENLALLGETVGLELELEGVERGVGPFRADILCRETANDSLVLVENQLERTDHRHLGQLLTYGAGLDAVTIIWIAERFTDEHRATLDWLNQITNENINFFGLEIEVWRIGDSPLAPKFNIVSKPNDWSRIVTGGSDGEVSEVKQLQLEFWQGLRDLLVERGSVVKPRQPRAQHWMNFAVGRSGFRLTAYANTREKRIGLQMVIHKGPTKLYFRQLHKEKAAIEMELDESVEWRELPDKKQSDITLDNPNLDPNRRSQWPQQHLWLAEQMEAFYRVFNPRIRALEQENPIDESDME